MTATKYERTPVDYPTEGFGGRTWNEIVKEAKRPREERNEERDEGEEDADGLPEVLEPAREWREGDALPGPLASYHKLAVANAWECKLGRSKFIIRGTQFKSGPRQGQWRPDKIGECVWLEAIKDRQLVTIVYEQIEGRAATCIGRKIGRTVPLSDKDMKARIKA